MPFFSPVFAQPAEISFTASAEDTSDLTTYTFSSQSIGVADSRRKIVVCIFGSATTATVSSVTVAGQSASQVVAKSYSPGNTEQVEIWVATVTSGTTGDVVVTWSAAQDGCGIGVFRMLTNATSAHDTGTAQAADANASTAASTTIDVPANGVCVAVVGARVATTGRSYTWSGLTEAYDATGITSAGNDVHSGASSAFSTAQTGLTVSATQDSGVTRESILAVASWGPS